MFNQTSNRLKEYMKEGSSSKLGLTLTLTTVGVTPKSSAAFIDPQWSSYASHQICNNENDIAHPETLKEMTIFYGGRVFVLENISSHKASDIMCLASSSTLPYMSNGLKKLDLSQTRTRSLTRFFERRNDRIKARASTYASNKLVRPNHKSWLQLAVGNQ